MTRLATLFLLALTVGCATVNRVPMTDKTRVEGGLEPIETVEISNTCWYFLSCLPIASGDVEAPDSWGSKWFRDTLTLDSQMKMLKDEIVRTGARRAVNVSTLATDEDCFLFVFLREKMHTSAVLAK